MKSIRYIHVSELWGLIGGNLLIMIMSIINEADVIFTLALMVWFICFIHSLCTLRENIVMFCFLLSFFVFMFGREVCYNYFGLSRYYKYLEPYNDITFILIIVSLLSLEIGYYLSSKKIKINNRKKNNDYILMHSSVKYQNICKYAFYFCYFVSIIYTCAQIILINRTGYLNTYMADYVGVSLPPVIGYIASFSNVALSLYLATCPKKKDAKISLFLYEIYAIMTLATGHRYTFIAISMYVIIYCFIRQRFESGWINKKNIVMIVLMIPAIIVLLTAIDSIRMGQEFSFKGIKMTAIQFLDQQGGSINVIKRVFYYQNEISDMKFTSLSNVRSVLFENSISRRIFNVVSYSGNSVENALHGHSLAHRLSYYEYGQGYLAGRGVGSSYIAELFLDFSFLGVIFGSAFYGVLIRKINDLRLDRFFRDGIFLSFVLYVLLAPRGNFDGFIGATFGLYSIIGMLVIWLFTKGINNKKV